MQKHSKAAIDSLETADYHIDKFVEYTQELTSHYVSETIAEYKIETKEKGGFDVIIGNPPYTLTIDRPIKEYFSTKYKTLKFKINLFACFMEKILMNLVNKDGYFSFIIPNLFYANDSLSSLRELILNNYNIIEMINCADGVFLKVSMPTMIFIIQNEFNPKNKIYNYNRNDTNLKGTKPIILNQKEVTNNYNSVIEIYDYQIKSIIDKFSTFECLDKIIDIHQGIITGNDKKYLSDTKISMNYKLTIKGKNIQKYQTNYEKIYVNYVKDELACPRTIDIFDLKEKLLMRRTGDAPILSYDDKQTFNLHTLSLVSKY